MGFSTVMIGFILTARNMELEHRRAVGTQPTRNGLEERRGRLSNTLLQLVYYMGRSDFFSPRLRCPSSLGVSISMHAIF